MPADGLKSAVNTVQNAAQTSIARVGKKNIETPTKISITPTNGINDCDIGAGKKKTSKKLSQAVFPNSPQIPWPMKHPRIANRNKKNNRSSNEMDEAKGFTNVRYVAVLDIKRKLRLAAFKDETEHI